MSTCSKGHSIRVYLDTILKTLKMTAIRGKLFYARSLKPNSYKTYGHFHQGTGLRPLRWLHGRLKPRPSKLFESTAGASFFCNFHAIAMEWCRVVHFDCLKMECKCSEVPKKLHGLGFSWQNSKIIYVLNGQNFLFSKDQSWNISLWKSGCPFMFPISKKHLVTPNLKTI